LATSFFFPFLQIGVTKENFYFSGKTQVVSDLLKIKQRGTENKAAQSRRIDGGIVSIPGPLYASKLIY
jgi:hypothetical protein